MSPGAGNETPARAGPGTAWWTTPQLLFLIIQGLVVLAVAGFLLLADPEAMSLLWLTQPGRKLLLVCAILLAGNLCAVLLLGGLLNVVMPPGKPDTLVSRLLIQFIVAALVFGFLLVPVLMILHTGPATIQIMDHLKPGGAPP